jgi:hypothetical protein
MDCVCGCGIELPRRLVPTNLIAFLLALEIAEWDRFRTLLSEAGGGPPSEDTNRFVADGAYAYESCLDVLHGVAFKSDHRAIKRWRKYSQKHRKKIAKMGAPIDGNRDVEQTEDRLAGLNRERPDQSYSGTEYDVLAQIDRELGED